MRFTWVNSIKNSVLKKKTDIRIKRITQQNVVMCQCSCVNVIIPLISPKVIVPRWLVTVKVTYCAPPPRCNQIGQNPNWKNSKYTNKLLPETVSVTSRIVLLFITLMHVQLVHFLNEFEFVIWCIKTRWHIMIGSHVLLTTESGWLTSVYGRQLDFWLIQPPDHCTPRLWAEVCNARDGERCNTLQAFFFFLFDITMNTKVNNKAYWERLAALAFLWDIFADSLSHISAVGTKRVVQQK